MDILLIQVRRIVAWTLVFYIVFYLAAATFVPSLVGVPLLAPRFSPFGSGSAGPRVPRGALRVLSAPEGRISLRDRPCAPTTRAEATAGTLVRIVDGYQECDEAWLLVERLDDGTQGWVPSSSALDPAQLGPGAGNFQLCAGDVAGPRGPCASSLPLSEGGMWLRWDQAGLRAGDRVQLLVTVGGLPHGRVPVRWQGEGAAQQRVNILAELPSVPPGQWGLQIIVNEQMVGQQSFEVR